MSRPEVEGDEGLRAAYLEELGEAILTLELGVSRVVRRLRDEGVCWREIGALTRMTDSGARRKYGDLEEWPPGVMDLD